MRNIRMVAIAAALICGIGVSLSPVRADGEKKKHDNCLIVKGVPDDSRVYLEYKDERGNWQKHSSKMVRKNDKGETMFCGLKPGTTYRVLGRRQGDANEGNWQEVTFQPNKDSGAHEIQIVIKMPEEQKRPGLGLSPRVR